LQVNQQAAEFEKAAAGLQFDQEVDVAIRSGFAAGDRAKHPDVVCAMACGDSYDILPLISKEL
jgi:hypothetical protein